MSERTPVYRSINELLTLERRLLLQHLPLNPDGDNLFALIQFVTLFNRFPENNALFGDFLFLLRTSDEILNPLRVSTTDKELAKEFIEQTVGREFVIPTLGLLRSEEDVRTFSFPDDCIIKPTHAAGQVERNISGHGVNLQKVTELLSLDHYRKTRETNYRDLKKKVIVEPPVFGEFFPRDYKFFCFDGVPKLVGVNFDRGETLTRNFYDCDWNDVPINWSGVPRNHHVFERPRQFDLMLDIATALSTNFNFVRIDLYADDNQVFVGEITHCPSGALRPFHTPADEDLMSTIMFGDG